MSFQFNILIGICLGYLIKSKSYQNHTSHSYPPSVRHLFRDFVLIVKGVRS